MVKNCSKVIRSKNLASNQEENANGSKSYDPCGDGHHGFRQTREEGQQRFAFFANSGQRYPQDYCKEDKTEDIGAASPFSLELPSEGVVGVSPLAAVHVASTVVVPALWPDQSSPVLLHGGLDQVGGAELSDEVHQGVRCSHVPGVESLLSLQ